MPNAKNNYLLSYVPMIDSQCQTQRNQPVMNTSNFYRSPLRDRQNRMNISNTPLRNGKPSLSPLRMRKNDQSYTNVNNSTYNPHNNSTYNPSTSIKSTVSRKTKDLAISNINITQACFNHSDKAAKFYVQTPEETMYCCQKCAILLASQGFRIAKLSPNDHSHCQIQTVQTRPQQNNRRKQQIQGFMSRLQQVLKKLKSIQNVIQGKFQQGESIIEQQLGKIQDYYQQFHQILNEHKQKVVTQLKEQYQKHNKDILQARHRYKQALEESESMKNDILQSWNDIIFVAGQDQYRPVINAYNQKLRNFQKLTTTLETQKINQTEIYVRKLYFKNIDDACEALAKGLQIQWADEEQTENNQEDPEQKQDVSQTEQNPIEKYSQQSDLPENPVECVQKQQKFIKSSLKDLAGLFSSFDQ